MKKLVKFLAAAVLGIGLSAGVVSAQAAPFVCGNVSISNGNGTGSTNTVTCENDKNVVINCANNVNINLTTGQTSTSGTATGNSNTTVGSVTTGDAGNSSFVSTAVNAACEAACNCSQQTPPAVTPTATTTPSGGQGGGVVAAATTTAKVAALPKTGENSAVKNLGIATAGAGMVGIAAQAGILAYRRRALKS